MEEVTCPANYLDCILGTIQSSYSHISMILIIKGNTWIVDTRGPYMEPTCPTFWASTYTAGQSWHITFNIFCMLKWISIWNFGCSDLKYQCFQTIISLNLINFVVKCKFALSITSCVGIHLLAMFLFWTRLDLKLHIETMCYSQAWCSF